ncbi:oligoendopeptidase F [Bacillus sp. AGMB 02131]|uniref:Oligopeptidase F n=1 Tax=Peribacillus faecalis TaxID=2772559 RepID=A0A927HCX6_9BACI|nr:oligoendopeptidase F [Peribacillus faecalis]MBD3109986.1 oligoendopeptidase F [Peribacillus faecalis]
MQVYKQRTDVPQHEKWDLTHIYASVQDWEDDFKKAEKLGKELKQFDGNIDSGQQLLQFLQLQEELSKTFTKVFAYARLSNDLDTRDSATQVLLSRSQTLSYQISKATSFFTPFLLSLDESVLKTYIEENAGLKYFEDDLWESFRYKKHVLSKEQEEVISAMGEALSSSSNTFTMLNNADIKFGDVTNDDGEQVELTRGMYTKIMESDDREKRKEAYKAFSKPYVQLKNTFASTLSSNIKNNVTMSKLRHYPSALEKALMPDEVPLEVYENLIATTKKHLHHLHAYSALRKEILGLDELHQYDMSIDLVKQFKKEIPYEEAYETMLTALKPLGDEYIETLASFKDANYIDVRETPGKMSGAYNFGVYGVHPYVLLNHQDNLDSLFTLAHEMGHAMHSYYSSKTQPYITARYTIFVAEVASTVNEVLLINHLLKQADSKEERKYLLNHFIDQFRGTFFTQVMFAEFEKLTHEKAEKEEALNADVFNGIYEDLYKEYYGDVVVLDEEVKYNWARIPHFYRPFYVYKYATGFASAIAIAKKLLKGNKEDQQAYLDFLKSGSSDYPLELLKKTGVDLNSSEPIESALTYFGELLEEFASI